ncbi:MAG: hypothetical protein ACPH5P_00080 [Akkermansiaceae bacterium]
MGSLSDRRKQKAEGISPRKPNIPWDEIESLYCAGYSAVDIAGEYKEFDITADKIRKRSHNKQWPTPYNLRKRAAQLIKQAQGTSHETGNNELAESAIRESNPMDALAKRVAKQSLTHQNTVLDITEKALQKLQESDRTIIRSAHDFELVDRIARRTMDLDKEDELSGLAININGFGHEPKQANGHVVDISPEGNISVE